MQANKKATMPASIAAYPQEMEKSMNKLYTALRALSRRAGVPHV